MEIPNVFYPVKNGQQPGQGKAAASEKHRVDSEAQNIQLDGQMYAGRSLGMSAHLPGTLSPRRTLSLEYLKTWWGMLIAWLCL